MWCTYHNPQFVIRFHILVECHLNLHTTHNLNLYLDGVLKRSVVRSSKSALYLDSAFYSNSSAVNSLTFGPLSRINRFSNYAVGGGGLLDMSGNGYQADLNSSAITFDSGGFYFNGDAAGVITVPVTNSMYLILNL